MKLLFAILLLFSVRASAQIPSGTVNIPPSVKRPDTLISCTMLICDTLHYTNYNEDFHDNYFDKIGVTFWVSGYLLVERYYSGYVFIRYLDSNKKPLSKYISVWMCKY